MPNNRKPYSSARSGGGGRPPRSLTTAPDQTHPSSQDIDTIADSNIGNAAENLRNRRARLLRNSAIGAVAVIGLYFILPSMMTSQPTALTETTTTETTNDTMADNGAMPTISPTAGQPDASPGQTTLQLVKAGAPATCLQEDAQEGVADLLRPNMRAGFAYTDEDIAIGRQQVSYRFADVTVAAVNQPIAAVVCDANLTIAAPDTVMYRPNSKTFDVHYKIQAAADGRTTTVSVMAPDAVEFSRALNESAAVSASVRRAAQKSAPSTSSNNDGQTVETTNYGGEP